jgi:hypothetical protein
MVIEEGIGLVLAYLLVSAGSSSSQQGPNSTWLILIERSASRSQIKLMYGSHHQQSQNDSRSDELDPFLIV